MQLIILINVDWFFASHFLHLARRARALGWDVTVATHVETCRDRLQEEGLRVVPLPPSRGGMLPSGLLDASKVVAGELRRSPQAVLHAFGLFGILVATLAGLRAGVPRRVFTITGRGYTAVSSSLRAKAMRSVKSTLCGRLADGRGARWIAENAEDLEVCGLARAVGEGRAIVVGGAGVDAERFAPTVPPPMPPLKVAIVARMIWSKGIDTAVDAIRRLREGGRNVELTIVGPLDPANPRAFDEGDMRRLLQVPGVEWAGRVENIAGLWAEHHVGVLPSRGGEGVPKSLIEACACGRPIITTDVPGCRDIAKASGGIIVPPGDAQALADALASFADGKVDIAAMGSAARSAVLEGYTEEMVWEAALRFYLQLQAIR